MPTSQFAFVDFPSQSLERTLLIPMYQNQVVPLIFYFWVFFA